MTLTYPDGPGHRGVPTSVAAAGSLAPSYLKGSKLLIVALLHDRGENGATYDEIVAECGLPTPTVCGRMVELVRAGLVKNSGRTRNTASGRQARIYVLA